MALNTQIKVGADSSGVATGLEPGKRALKDFGASADGAGKSLAGMGNGSAQSAQKVEQATKSMIQSIQRTTAATEAGDKSTRAYQESLARMRGIDVAALKPYLDQLDAVKAKQLAATASTEKFANTLDAVKLGAMAAGVAAAGIAVSFVATAKALIEAADGMNDLSQRVGIAVQDLAKYELATSQSGTSMEAFAKGLKGLSVNLVEHGDALRKVGITAKDSDGAMKQFADIFAAMPDGIEKTTLAVKVFGKSGMDLIPTLNLGAAGLELAAEKAAKYAEQMAVMAPLADAYNDNLAELAMASKVASMATVNNMLPAMVTISQAMAAAAQDAGVLQAAWVGLGGVGWELVFKPIQVIWKGINNSIDEANASLMRFFNKNDQSDILLARVAQRNKEILALAEENDRPAAEVKKDDGLEKWKDQYKELMAAMKETGKTAKTVREEVNKAAKEDISAFKVMADLKTKFEGEEIARVEKTREELEKTMEAYAKAAEAGVASAIATATAAEAELSNYGLLKSEVQALGLVQLEQARESAAMAGEDVANIEKRIAAQKRLIAATKGVEVRTASDNAAKEAAAEWKRTADSIQNTLTDALMRGFESGKDFARNLRDTVVNMFKTLVLRPVISAVLNPIAGAVSGALGLSGAAQAAGAATSGASAIGAAGTLASLATTAASWGTAAGAGFMATIGGSTIAGGGAAGILATGGAAGAGTAGMIGALGPYALAALAVLAIHDMTQGETRNGAKYGVGSDGKAMKLEGPSGGEIAATQAQAMFNVAKSSIEGMLTGLGSKAVLTGFTAGLESSDNGKGFAYATGQINGKSFGDANTYMNSRGGKTQEQALKDYQLELTQSILEGLQITEDIPASIAKLISDGLNGSEVKALSLEATSAILANVETLSKQVATFGAAMTQLPFEALKDLSFDATAGLIAVAGGFEKLDASLSSYYTNFYTSEEQRAQLTTNTAAAFAALGETMPALDDNARSVYRSMVDAAAGMDLSVEANAKAYAGLLSLNGAMNDLAPTYEEVANAAANASRIAADAAKTAADAADAAIKQAADAAAQTAKQAADAAAALASVNRGWQDQLDLLTGKETDRSIALRDAGDESTRVIMRQVHAQQDLAKATQDSAEAIAKAIESTRAFQQTIVDIRSAQMALSGADSGAVGAYQSQASIDAAFADYKKTDRFGINDAAQFKTITASDLKNYTAEQQQQITTILRGFVALIPAAVSAAVPESAAPTTFSTPAADASIADAIARITKGLTDAGVSLGVELLKAQGNMAGAAAAQKAIDTAGYTEAQVAIYDFNQTLRDSITAANEAAAAQQAFNSKRQSLQQQYDDLTMNQAQQRNAEWLSLNAQDPTGQLSGLQIAIWDFGDAAAKTAKDIEDAAAATATAITRNDWRDRLDVLMGSRTQEQMDTQNALAGVTDLATVELILLVRGLEKTQAAAATAAAAAKELADQAEAAAKALASTNQGWIDQLDVLTGAQTDRSIALRDTTDESTRALMRQVYAQQDLKSAAEEATEAAATLKAAFESLESARVSVANAYNSIKDKAASAAAGVVSAQDAITQGYLSALDAQTAAQQNVADITRQAAVEMRGFADDIQDFILQMSTSDLGASSKAQQLAASQADFTVSAAQARSGDKNALAGITGKASNLLGAGKDQFASATDYARFTAKIGNTLQDLATLADGKAGPLAEAIDPMVKAQADLLKANQDVEKWTEAASVSGASTAKTVADYLSDWTRATAENALAQADLKAAQLLTQRIDLETLDVLGELRVLIESYNSAKSSVTDAGGILPSLAVGAVAIIPSVFNPIASGSGDTARLEALIDGLTQEVIGLRAEAQATAGHTSRTARLLDRAMPDGDALATRTAA